MGANAANRNLKYIGVSGDGDTLSIGLGPSTRSGGISTSCTSSKTTVCTTDQGTILASADIGTKAKKGETNFQPPIDPVLLAMTLGCVVRRAELLRRQTAARAAHPGGTQSQRVCIDRVLSPCVTFRAITRARTKSMRTRGSNEPARARRFRAVGAGNHRRHCPGETLPVVMHDRQSDRPAPMRGGLRPDEPQRRPGYIQERMKDGEYLTGLLFVEPSQENELQYTQRTRRSPLNSIRMRSCRRGRRDCRRSPRTGIADGQGRTYGSPVAPGRRIIRVTGRHARCAHGSRSGTPNPEGCGGGQRSRSSELSWTAAMWATSMRRSRQSARSSAGLVPTKTRSRCI